MSQTEMNGISLNSGVGTSQVPIHEESTPPPRYTMDEIKTATTFKALSCEQRLKLMKILREARDPLTVESIAGLAGIRHSVASTHLKVLAQSDMVTRTTLGRFVLYTVNNLGVDRVVELIRALRKEEVLV